MATVAQLDALGLRQTIREELDRSGMANLVRQLQSGAVLATALPSSALAGQEVYLQTAAMAAMTPPLMWRLRYDGSKWAVVAGTPLFSEIDSYISNLSGPDRAVTGTTYVALAVPLTVVLPVVGWYDIELGMGGYHGSQGGVSMMSYDIGATPASDVDAVGWQSALAAVDVQRVWRSQRKQFTSAPVTLTAKFRTLAGTANLRGPKSIKATPVLLG